MQYASGVMEYLSPREWFQGDDTGTEDPVLSVRDTNDTKFQSATSHFKELPLQPPRTLPSPMSCELNTNALAAFPAAKDHVKVETFLDLHSKILSKLESIHASLFYLEASKASKDDLKAMMSVAGTKSSALPFPTDEQYPSRENPLAEVGEMLDKRFENQFACLEKMLLKFKYIEKVDVEHDQLQADQTSPVKSKHSVQFNGEHDQLEADQTSPIKSKHIVKSNGVHDQPEAEKSSGERNSFRSDQGQTNVEDEDEEEVERVALEAAHRTSVKEWTDFQDRLHSNLPDDDEGALLAQFFDKGANPATFDVLPRNILRWLGCERCLPVAMPDTCFARAIEASWFQTLEFILIISGTITMALEANQNIGASLQLPKGEVSDAFFAINVFFNIAYALDLAFHIFALRSWFLFSSDWTWNLLDVLVVSFSCFSMMLRGVKLGFLRSLRIIRLVRVVRIIKVLRCFRELQAIMLAIYASLASLVWCLLFLALTMFIFSLFAVQMLNVYFEGADPLASGYEEERAAANEWYGSIELSMWSLFLCCMGWADFLDVMTPLRPAGKFTQIAFVSYIIFVTVGVMNVLVGVFSACASDVDDRQLMVQGEQIKTEQLVMNLCSLFAELDVDTSHQLDWPEFKKKMSHPDLQAYLATLDIDGTHAHMLFDLLDTSEKGYLTMQDFVMGMVKLKGNAKAIDARAIQRELTMMPKLIELLVSKHIPKRASSM